MPGTPDEVRGLELTGLLRERALTPEGRQLVDRLLAESSRYFQEPSVGRAGVGPSSMMRAVDALSGGFIRGHYDVDGRGHVEWVSPGLKTMLGIGDGDLGGTIALARRLGVDSVDALHRDHVARAARGENMRVDVRMLDVAGSRRWMRLVTVFDPLVDGRYPFVTLAFDVTSIRETREALVRSDAAFRAMLRGSRSAFALIDADHRLLWFNDVAVRYARHMEWATPEVGTPMSDIFGHEVHAYYLEAREQVLAGRTAERRMSFRARTGPARTFDISFVPVRRPDGEIFGIGFTGSDVSRQVEAEQAVVESDRILACLPLGVATVDPQGIIQRWRAAAPEMFDLPSAMAEGLSLVDLLVIEHEQRVWPRIEEALLRGHELRVEVDARRPDGAQIPVEISLSPLPGSLGHMVAVIEDVTTRRALQRQVIESQKMEAVGLFAAGLAHDFNNLLAAIVGHTAMLGLDMAEDDPLRAEVTGIEQTTSRAATLVRSMLSLARQRSGSASTIDLAAAVRRARPLLVRVAGRGRTVSTQVDVESIAVRVDRVQLEQVLVNLVVNARDASPENGQIQVRVSECVLDGPQARAMSMVPGRTARIDVTDEGEGIPPALVQRIFDPFFTTKGEGRGTGLGLSICRQILRSSGGDIRIEAMAGRGTCVRLWLPCSPNSPAPGRVDEGPAMVGGDEHILLVEDVADLRQVWSRLLERLGYRISTAADGIEALALLDSGQTFDLLVSDVVMPRVGGLAVARRFRELYPGRPIMMVSAYPGDAFDTGPLIELDAELLRKPLTGPSLVRRIRTLLG